MKKATQSAEFSKGAVRITLGPGALRAQCATAAGELEQQALAVVTALLHAPTSNAGEILRAVEMAERYEAGAQKLRKWSGRFK